MQTMYLLLEQHPGRGFKCTTIHQSQSPFGCRFIYAPSEPNPNKCTHFLSELDRIIPSFVKTRAGQITNLLLETLSVSYAGVITILTKQATASCHEDPGVDEGLFLLQIRNQMSVNVMRCWKTQPAKAAFLAVRLPETFLSLAKIAIVYLIV